MDGWMGWGDIRTVFWFFRPTIIVVLGLIRYRKQNRYTTPEWIIAAGGKKTWGGAGVDWRKGRYIYNTFLFCLPWATCSPYVLRTRSDLLPGSLRCYNVVAIAAVLHCLHSAKFCWHCFQCAQQITSSSSSSSSVMFYFLFIPPVKTNVYAWCGISDGSISLGRTLS